MKNVWKGLVVGGLTGVAAGILLDALDTASDRAHAVGRRVAEHAADLPAPADLVRSVAQHNGADQP